MIKTAAALQCSTYSEFITMLFCPLVECWNFLQKFEYKASPEACGRPSILTMEFDFRVEFCTHVLQSLSSPCHVKQQRNLDFDCIALASCSIVL